MLVQIIFTGSAFRIVTEGSCAPSISVYLPADKSGDGLMINFTVFVLPSINDIDSSLNDHVEFPKSPVGIKVADAVILTASTVIE